jgi:hypothetical protein
MEDTELKKKLKKIPNADAGGDPIYKIDAGAPGSKEKQTG